MSVRKVLESLVKLNDTKDAAVLLSGGMDSASVLFSLIDACKNITAYSFTMEGTESTDFVMARKMAEEFNIKFVPIFLPSDLGVLKSDLLTLVKLGAETKTDFECGWPMLYAYKIIKETYIYSGLGADGHFCISKKGMIHYKNKIDEFRLLKYSSETYCQMHIHKKLCLEFNKVNVVPYLTQLMREEFLGTTWDEVNRPKLKQSILDSYPEYFKKTYHASYQKGDSGISTHFEQLLKTELNINNNKSVVGIYNRLVKEFNVKTFCI